MRRGLKKGICLLVSVMMVIGSMPMGVLAEETNTASSMIINDQSFSANSIDASVADEAVKPNDTAVAEIPTEDTQSLRQTMATAGMLQTAETIQTMAADSTIAQDPGKTGGDATVAVADKTITFGGLIAYYEASASFPPESGNYVGAMVTAPEGVTPGTATTLTIGDKVYTGWDSFKDGSNFFYYYPKVTAAGQTFTFTVDWDGVDAANQTNTAPETFTINIAADAELAPAFQYKLVDGDVVITKYIGEDDVVTIPKTIGGKKVIGIGDNAFAGSVVKTVNFNDNIQFIGAGAFYNCDLLAEIDLPSSLTTIKPYDTANESAGGTFGNCFNLKKVVIPDNVTDMGAVDIFEDSPNVIIYGNKASFAQEYATEFDIAFQVDTLLNVTMFTASEASGQNVGTEIMLTASATGGTAPYKCEFYSALNGGVPVKLMSTTTTAIFMPTEAGKYTLYVKVTDDEGKTSIKTIDDYSVIDQPIVTLKTDKASGQYVNTEMTLTAKASGGTAPLQYKFYYKLGADTETIEDYSGNPSTTFTPDTAGTYTLYVDVTDENGLTSTASIAKYLVVNDLSVDSFKVKPENTLKGVNVNTKITLTAQGAGGKSSYQYKFYYQLDGEMYTIRDFSSSKTVYFEPETPGNYNLYVDVKNASGRISTEKITDYRIIDTPIVNNFTTDLTMGQYVGTAITLKAESSGGSDDYTYEFAYMLSGKTQTPLVTVNTNTAVFTPDTAGTYTLLVKVIDNKTKLESTKTITGYKVIDKVKVKSLKVNKTSGQNIKTAIKLTAAAAGGKAPYEYEFSYRLGTNAPVVLQEYSKHTTVYFTPDTAGDYTFSVKIRDANGNISTDTAKDITGFKIVNKPIISSFKPDHPSGQQYVKDDIELTAVASGGSTTLQYKFYSKKNGIIKDIQVSSTSNTAIFKPTEAGTYTLYVDVTDGTETTTKKITSYKVLAEVSIKSFTPAKASGQTLAIAKMGIKLTAVGSGGKTPYKYKFTYTKDGGMATPIQDSSTARTAYFKPTETGKYTLTVEITDYNGRTATTDITYEVK